MCFNVGYSTVPTHHCKLDLRCARGARGHATGEYAICRGQPSKFSPITFLTFSQIKKKYKAVRCYVEEGEPSWLLLTSKICIWWVFRGQKSTPIRLHLSSTTFSYAPSISSRLGNSTARVIWSAVCAVRLSTALTMGKVLKKLSHDLVGWCPRHRRVSLLFEISNTHAGESLPRRKGTPGVAECFESQSYADRPRKGNRHTPLLWPWRPYHLTAKCTNFIFERNHRLSL